MWSGWLGEWVIPLRMLRLLEHLAVLKRINQIIATNRHHSWTATAFGSAKKWRQRRVARDNAFSQSLSSTILEKSLRFILPGWLFCRALHQFKHDPGFHYSWDILTVHFARMFLRFCINLDINTNNLPRESRNIISIRDHDDECKQFHNVLTNFAKRICVSFFEKYGPSGSKYINNDFITWFNISAANTNTKGLYENIL